jgi:hypothetical protein
MIATQASPFFTSGAVSQRQLSLSKKDRLDPRINDCFGTFGSSGPYRVYKIAHEFDPLLTVILNSPSGSYFTHEPLPPWLFAHCEQAIDSAATVTSPPEHPTKITVVKSKNHRVILIQGS